VRRESTWLERERERAREMSECEHVGGGGEREWQRKL
jgi:hypothetical protein